MESVNYTYAKRKQKKIANGKSFITNGLGYPQIDSGNGAIHYNAHCIVDRKGKVIAEATSAKNAELIVAALNGVAP